MLPLITSIAPRQGPVLGLLLLAGVLFAAPTRADEADDQYAVAAGHYAQQRWKLAVEEFQVFLEKYPNHSKAALGVFFLAEAQLQAGNLPQAEARFREYLKREPGGKFALPALFRAGETAYLTGKGDLAKADLERFQSEYPHDKLNAYVLPYLGDVFLGEGNVAAAERCFRAGLKRFPNGRLQDDCRFGLARALEEQNQNQEAERL
ncbi:MAG: tol-pal system YbgF family protein, partial [Planctomycetota bacterium]